MDGHTRYYCHRYLKEPTSVQRTPTQCQTRWGESLRCLGTVGVYLNEHGQSTLILRLWPLGSARWFGVDGALRVGDGMYMI